MLKAVATNFTRDRRNVIKETKEIADSRRSPRSQRGHVHTGRYLGHRAPIDEGGAQLLSRQHRHSYAAGLHHGLRARRNQPDTKSAATLWAAAVHCTPAQIRQVSGRFIAYGMSALVPVSTPSRLASRTRAIWQYWHVPSLSGLLPALPGVSRIRLPSASPSRCDGQAVQVSHLHSDTQRLVAHNGIDEQHRIHRGPAAGSASPPGPPSPGR